MGIIGTPLGYIMYFIESLIHNYGLSLVIFILVTKIALFPISVKQQKSTVRMSKMTGKQQELQKRYGKDKQKYQEELMKLYEEEGYNPMSGCLPMIIQMVLLFGIVDVIYRPLKHLLHVSQDMIAQATSLLQEIMGKPVSTTEIAIITEIQNGSTAFDSIFGSDLIYKIQNFNMEFLGINMGAVPQWNNLLVIIPIISGITALASTLISMKIQERNGQSMQKGMKMTMYIMPLFSVWIGFSMPAGVGLYWILSNVTMIAQQIIVQVIWSPEKVALMKDKSREKTREKMRKKRERMEEYNKMLEAKGMAPKPIPKKIAEPKVIDREELEREKEAASRKLAEARRRMAEKYGEQLDDSEDKK